MVIRFYIMFNVEMYKCCAHKNNATFKYNINIYMKCIIFVSEILESPHVLIAHSLYRKTSNMNLQINKFLPRKIISNKYKTEKYRILVTSFF